ARCYGGSFRLESGNPRLRALCKRLRQRAGKPAFELPGQLRKLLAIAGKKFVPGGFALGAAGARIPGGIDRLRNDERRMAPSKLHACRCDFVLAEWGAVTGFLALLVRGAETDDGPGADQGRLVGAVEGRTDRRTHGVGIVSVNPSHDIPAVGFEPRRGVAGKPAFDFAVARDAVVVPDGDQIPETRGAGERGDRTRK